MSISRRNFLRAGAVVAGTLAAGMTLPGRGIAAQSRAKVYAAKSLDSETLRKMYALVNGGITGRVAIKLHTGEPDGPNILPRDWVRDLQATIPQSSIVECNVLYASPRQTTEGHREVIRHNGWTFCPVDIMDADGDASLPVKGGQAPQGTGRGIASSQL
ncbi:twin-arginine translocation signal domain-containing protein [uncultured Mailhella sp.]|uniref:twin-arginine translocation signal domain-containing protein n=1 Tax=uncultured Mailhella sp. TaxID=1981031 RepID=UPI00320879D8